MPDEQVAGEGSHLSGAGCSDDPRTRSCARAGRILLPSAGTLALSLWSPTWRRPPAGDPGGLAAPPIPLLLPGNVLDGAAPGCPDAAQLQGARAAPPGGCRWVGIAVEETAMAAPATGSRPHRNGSSSCKGGPGSRLPLLSTEGVLRNLRQSSEILATFAPPELAEHIRVLVRGLARDRNPVTSRAAVDQLERVVRRAVERRGEAEDGLRRECETLTHAVAMQKRKMNSMQERISEAFIKGHESGLAARPRSEAQLQGMVQALHGELHALELLYRRHVEDVMDESAAAFARELGSALDYAQRVHAEESRRQREAFAGLLDEMGSRCLSVAAEEAERMASELCTELSGVRGGWSGRGSGNQASVSEGDKLATAMQAVQRNYEQRALLSEMAHRVKFKERLRGMRQELASRYRAWVARRDALLAEDREQIALDAELRALEEMEDWKVRVRRRYRSLVRSRSALLQQASRCCDVIVKLRGRVEVLEADLHVLGAPPPPSPSALSPLKLDLYVEELAHAAGEHAHAADTIQEGGVPSKSMRGRR